MHSNINIKREYSYIQSNVSFDWTEKSKKSYADLGYVVLSKGQRIMKTESKFVAFMAREIIFFFLFIEIV